MEIDEKVDQAIQIALNKCWSAPIDCLRKYLKRDFLEDENYSLPTAVADIIQWSLHFKCCDRMKEIFEQSSIGCVLLEGMSDEDQKIEMEKFVIANGNIEGGTPDLLLEHEAIEVAISKDPITVLGIKTSKFRQRTEGQQSKITFAIIDISGNSNSLINNLVLFNNKMQIEDYAFDLLNQWMVHTQFGPDKVAFKRLMKSALPDTVLRIIPIMKEMVNKSFEEIGCTSQEWDRLVVDTNYPSGLLDTATKYNATGVHFTHGDINLLPKPEPITLIENGIERVLMPKFVNSGKIKTPLLFDNFGYSIENISNRDLIKEQLGSLFFSLTADSNKAGYLLLQHFLTFLQTGTEEQLIDGHKFKFHETGQITMKSTPSFMEGLGVNLKQKYLVEKTSSWSSPTYQNWDSIDPSQYTSLIDYLCEYNNNGDKYDLLEGYMTVPPGEKYQNLLNEQSGRFKSFLETVEGTNLFSLIKKTIHFNWTLHQIQCNQYSTIQLSPFRSKDRFYGFVLSGPIHIKSQRTSNFIIVFEKLSSLPKSFGFQTNVKFHSSSITPWSELLTSKDVGSTGMLRFIDNIFIPIADVLEQAEAMFLKGEFEQQVFWQEIGETCVHLLCKAFMYNISNSPLMEEALAFETMIAKAQLSHFWDYRSFVKQAEKVYRNQWLPNIIIKAGLDRLKLYIEGKGNFVWNTHESRTVLSDLLSDDL